MIAFAREKHADASAISYFVADISSADPFHGGLEAETADIVLSIHCLHWIPESEQGKAMANIRSIMKPGAICYIILFSWSDMLPLQEQLVYHVKWRKYFKNIIEEEDRNTSHLRVGKESERRRRRSSAPFPTFDPPSAEERIRVWKQRCSDLFFTDTEVTLNQVSFNFGDWKSFQGKKRDTDFRRPASRSLPILIIRSYLTEELKSICHFLPYIPPEEQNLFLEDYYEHVKNTYAGRQGCEDGDPVVLTYEYILIQAKKPQSSSSP